MQNRASMPQRLTDLGSRLGHMAQERLGSAPVENLRETAGAARRRADRARFASDGAYIEHLITQAVRRGRVEHDAGRTSR